MKNAIVRAATPIAKHAITVDSAGRIVLPSAVRRRLNLTTGSRLTLDVVAQRIELTPQPDADAGLQIVAGRRTVLRPTGQAFDAAAVVRAERDTQAGPRTRR
jgi:AbrB family looped-hinge helix DNA binding protein